MSEFRALAFPVLSSPAVDAAVIEGRARGYADGLAAARAAAADAEDQRHAEHQRSLQHAQERSVAAVQSLHRAAEELTGRHVQSLTEVQEHLYAAACQLAEIVLGAELSDASGAARAAMARVLREQTPAPVHTVRLPPEVAAAAQAPAVPGEPAGADGTSVAAGAPAGLRILADPSLPPGGAVAEYPEGWLDAGIETALDRIARDAAGARS